MRDDVIMKKFLALAAAGVICLSAAGCNKAENLANRAADEVKNLADEDENANQAENAEESKKDEPLTEIPEEIAAYGFDRGLPLGNNLYLPYSSEDFDYDENFMIISNNTERVFSESDKTEERFSDLINHAKTDMVQEYNAQIEEMKIGGFDVTMAEYAFMGYTRDYYVRLNGDLADNACGAYVSVTYSSEEEAEPYVIELMIENIFEAE